MKTEKKNVKKKKNEKDTSDVCTTQVLRRWEQL
jgi:hypothetical protein